MHDYLWYAMGAIVFLNWYLYYFEVLPKIKKYRQLYLRDWGFSAFHPLNNLNEYRDICEKENESLIWYNTQRYSLYIFVGTGAIWVLTA